MSEHARNFRSSSRLRGLFLGTSLVLSGALFAWTPAMAAPTDTFCTPVQVLDWGSRVHVLCASAVGGVRYFAVSTSDPQRAARVLSLASTALIAGRTLVINFDPADLSGAAFGCQTNDCRVIRAIGFGQ